MLGPQLTNNTTEVCGLDMLGPHLLSMQRRCQLVVWIGDRTWEKRDHKVLPQTFKRPSSLLVMVDDIPSS